MKEEAVIDSNLGLVRHEDVLQPFMLHNSVMRGRMVRLDTVLNAILQRHDYPDSVSKLLGELLVIGAMLSANLPDHGILTLQIKADGAVPMMVVDIQADGSVRGYAHIDDMSAIPDESNAGLQALLGKGYLAMTLDAKQGEAPYQSIVPLEGESLSQAVQYYFSQSQQLDVVFHIHVSRRIRENNESRWVGAGIMLERMPEMQETSENSATGNANNWEYQTLLVSTASEEELSDPHLAPSALLYRLFHETGVWVYDTHGLRDECRCSRTRIDTVLRTMSDEDLQHMADEEGMISVNCQFCNTAETFSISELG